MSSPIEEGHVASTIIANDGAEHVVRLFNYVAGVTFDDARGVTVSTTCGRSDCSLGGVNQALASFQHPAADHFMGVGHL